MIRGEALRDLARKRRLRYLVGVEADRERGDARAGRGGRGDDDARVDAAREKEPERHVRNHLLRDRRADQRAQLLARSLDRRSSRLSGYGQAPVAAWGGQCAGIGRVDELVRRRELVAALVQRLRRGHVPVAQEVVAGAAVDLELRGLQSRLDGLELRREGESSSVVVIIEGLDAWAVAVEAKLSLARVPDDDREHAVDPLDEVGAPFEIRVQRDFRIRVRQKYMTELKQGALELAVTVDLAVEDDPARAVGRPHRLVGRGPQIDDRKAAKPDSHGAFETELARVGTAMRDRAQRGGVAPIRIGSANEPAHRALRAHERCRMPAL